MCRHLKSFRLEKTDQKLPNFPRCPDRILPPPPPPSSHKALVLENSILVWCFIISLVTYALCVVFVLLCSPGDLIVRCTVCGEITCVGPRYLLWSITSNYFTAFCHDLYIKFNLSLLFWVFFNVVLVPVSNWQYRGGRLTGLVTYLMWNAF